VGSRTNADKFDQHVVAVVVDLACCLLTLYSIRECEKKMDQSKLTIWKTAMDVDPFSIESPLIASRARPLARFHFREPPLI
jgi:hypothetical protein